ncbi:hypothetical protein D3C81_1827100 [compost metagenome]
MEFMPAAISCISLPLSLVAISWESAPAEISWMDMAICSVALLVSSALTVRISAVPATCSAVDAAP